jgi:hypothetical protein
MPTQRLEHGASGPPAAESEPGDDALGALLESSPARVVRTSAAAEVAFLCGLIAVLAVPFSLMAAVCVGLSAVALVASIVGLARASKPGVSGGLLASIGLVLSLATLTLVGLRYLGIDTAVGDAAVPTLADWLAALNTLLPMP